MTCGEARRLAWPDGAPRAVDESAAAADAHIAECVACRTFIADMRMMAERLAASAPRPSAPREVRERLFTRLARARSDAERTQARLAVKRWLAAAGVAALVILAAGVWRLSSVRARSADIAARLADDHRRVLHGDGIISADSVVVSQWLSSRIGFAVRVPVFTNGQLVGARVADVNGSRGAVLAYRVDGRDVSYYIIPFPGAPTGGEMTRTPVVQVSSWSGFHIAAWSEPGLTHALVGDLPGARLSGLAHECIRQMAGSLVFPATARLGTPSETTSGGREAGARAPASHLYFSHSWTSPLSALTDGPATP
jgi:anti-sigma factor RsiW